MKINGCKTGYTDCCRDVPRRQWQKAVLIASAFLGTHLGKHTHPAM